VVTPCLVGRRPIGSFRRDPRDSGKTIIPDLAHSWEIAEDGKTYMFFLRKGVQFHDGAELTPTTSKPLSIALPSLPQASVFRAVSCSGR
jgi:peptide/nickel transport system substrate-binding protein